MTFERKVEVDWAGSVMEGKGTAKAGSGAFNLPVTSHGAHDLTVHLLRPPRGEWVCLDSVTHVDGIGMTDTALWDDDGRIGRAAQTLLVRART